MTAKWVFVFAALTFVLALVEAEIDELLFRDDDAFPEDLTVSLRRRFNGTWISDDEFFFDAGGSIYKYNVATHIKSLLASKEDLLKYKSPSFTISSDNKKLLVRHNRTKGFRHSFKAQYDIYDIEKKTSTSIHKGAKLSYCEWCPRGERLAYVFENNVYIHIDGQRGIQLTNDGVPGIVYNGVPDWVYEEEVLYKSSALWWSPDGKRLAVGSFNDTKVETFKYFVYDDSDTSYYPYPKELDLKYPKAGSTNPTVQLRVFDLSSGDISERLIPTPVHIVSNDHILQHVGWSNATQLLIIWLNRRQNLATLKSCSYEGACAEILRIEEPNGWVSIKGPKCLSNGFNCIFKYWIGNWYQVWNLDLRTGVNLWRSRGNFTVQEIYGYDEVRQKLYYRATLPDDFSVNHVYSNDECLTCNSGCLSSTASFSQSFSYYAIICNGPSVPRVRLSPTDPLTRSAELEWEANEAIHLYYRPTYRFLNVALADGRRSMVKLELPPNFNESSAYPLIVEVYGGPDSTNIRHDYSNNVHSVVGDLFCVYAYIDGRGTANKGKDFLFSINNNLGGHEVEDQLFVTKWLQDNLKFVIRERTAIWGWSHGGYLTAKIIQKDNSQIFRCGISVAPVVSFLYYDSIYTERYMGLPTVQDNLKKYKENSVLGDLNNFRYHDYLLVHGSADDNVHYQNALLLAKRLQHQNIQFEEHTYTDQDHNFLQTRSHFTKLMQRFWHRCLKPPISN